MILQKLLKFPNTPNDTNMNELSYACQNCEFLVAKFIIFRHSFHFLNVFPDQI